MMTEVRIVEISVLTGKGIRDPSRVLVMFSLYLGDEHIDLYICKTLSSSTLRISALNCL